MNPARGEDRERIIKVWPSGPYSPNLLCMGLIAGTQNNSCFQRRVTALGMLPTSNRTRERERWHKARGCPTSGPESPLCVADQYPPSIDGRRLVEAYMGQTTLIQYNSSSTNVTFTLRNNYADFELFGKGAWGLRGWDQSQAVGNLALLYPVQLLVTISLEYLGPAFPRNDFYSSNRCPHFPVSSTDGLMEIRPAG